MRKTRSRARTERRAAAALGACALVAAFSCRFDPAYRDVPPPPTRTCSPGALRCEGSVLQNCVGDDTSQAWRATDDCAVHGLTCAPSLSACAMCVPGATECQKQTLVRCDSSGKTWQTAQVCDGSQGYACRDASCVQLCELASRQQSNVGCEYWGADLDNADISPSLNAAAQQYAMVVSNVQTDVATSVSITQDDSQPGQPAQTRVVATASIAPLSLQVFKLGPREVDGSADGTFDTGTGTALTRHAYRITSTFPIVAYQFNPLDNFNVFSNDASLLFPVSGLNSGVGRAYVIPGWPQTIAVSSDATQNFGMNLRAFVAIIGTRPDTHVHIQTTARVIPGGPFPAGIAQGASGDATLQPFEVLNLETGDFNADFTGTLLDADGPVAVFPGSEASDAPDFQDLSQRFCCADHLEHQTAPLRTVGKSYVAAKMPNRTTAVIAAGAQIGEIQETEYYRVVAAASGTTHVKTTLPAPWDAFDLTGEGDFKTLASKNDFLINASQPAMVLDVQSSQDAGGVGRGLPGGDPSTAFLAPIEQWRNDYVLLTPDKYVFDYLVLVAPNHTHVYIDGIPIDATNADVTPSDGLTPAQRGSPSPPYFTYRYQLSYPIIDPTQSPPNNIKPGKQNDGVHHIQADEPVGVVAYGFDSYVSYAYTGGTQLTVINTQ